MLLKALRRFAAIIEEVRVDRFVRVANTYELKASIKFKDGSILSIKDYLFADGVRKYAYHWQRPDGRLIRRWDNAPRWPDLAGAPHHCHIGNEVIEPSSPADILSVFEKIESIIMPKACFSWMPRRSATEADTGSSGTISRRPGSCATTTRVWISKLLARPTLERGR
jgi:hypothetical protein